MLALRLPPDIEKRLDDLAKRTGPERRVLCPPGILEHLEDMEDLAIADERLRRPGDVDAGRRSRPGCLTMTAIERARVYGGSNSIRRLSRTSKASARSTGNA